MSPDPLPPESSPPGSSSAEEPAWRRLPEVARVALQLGCLGFGGPAAHLALLEAEVVEKRSWLDRQYFLDLMSATHLIPGPNSTEMVIHVGYLRAGAAGLWLAGLCFILPAVAISTLLAWCYVEYGQTPDFAPVLAGIRPVVLVVIVAAIQKLGRKALRSADLIVLGVLALAATLLGVGELLTLPIGGILGMLWLRARASRGAASGNGRSLLVGGLGGGLSAAASNGRTAWAAGAAAAGGGAAAGGAIAPASIPLIGLGLYFLQIGAILYGSGYVLVAFLEGGLVDERGWLTSAELFDAIAVGQMTPGPLLSTSAFIGYLLRGVPGAGVASLGMFLPSFLFVALLGPLLMRWRRSPWVASFLDAVNVVAVGLMVAAAARLGREALVSLPTLAIACGAALLLFRFRVSALWLIPAGGLAGALIAWLG